MILDDLIKLRDDLQGVVGRLNVIIGNDPLVDISRTLARIEGLAINMDANTTAILKRIDDATTKIAAEVSDLKSQISTSMSQADVDSLNSSLDSVASRLEGIGADPNNPVPSGTTTATDTGSTSGQ